MTNKDILNNVKKLRELTGVGFQPDLTWIKETGATGDHFLCDVVRGVTKYILSLLCSYVMVKFCLVCVKNVFMP